MPLNFGTGQTKPYAKYNSKADKWFGPNGEEIGRPTFVADFDNLCTGWLRFREGQPPERRIDPSPDRASPCPGDGFKQGFVVALYSEKYFGGTVEFSSASMHVRNAIADLYNNAWEKERDDHPGELPVVVCTGSQTMPDRYGVNYKPILTISEVGPSPGRAAGRESGRFRRCLAGRGPCA